MAAGAEEAVVVVVVVVAAEEAKPAAVVTPEVEEAKPAAVVATQEVAAVMPAEAEEEAEEVVGAVTWSQRRCIGPDRLSRSSRSAIRPEPRRRQYIGRPG